MRRVHSRKVHDRVCAIHRLLPPAAPRRVPNEELHARRRVPAIEGMLDAPDFDRRAERPHEVARQLPTQVPADPRDHHHLHRPAPVRRLPRPRRVRARPRAPSPHAPRVPHEGAHAPDRRPHDHGLHQQAFSSLSTRRSSPHNTTAARVWRAHSREPPASWTDLPQGEPRGRGRACKTSSLNWATSTLERSQLST